MASKRVVEKVCLWCPEPSYKYIYCKELEGHLCSRCYQRWRAQQKLVEHELPPPGEVRYDERGYPICHLCGLAYRKVLSHAWQVHGITAAAYKKRFGLFVGVGICCEETRTSLRESVAANFDLVVRANLLRNGAGTRFTPGHQGRPRRLVCLQLHRILGERGRKALAVLRARRGGGQG